MLITENKINQKDRIKLPFTFDTTKLIEEITLYKQANFEYYDVVPLRAPAHLVDNAIPFPPPAADYADGTWCEWLDTKDLINLPYINSIIDFFKENCTVNLVRLLRLAPNAIVKEHVDPTLALEVEKSMIRLTIPIIKEKGVDFYLNNTIVAMEPGECWYLKLNDPHKIINNTNTVRINLTIDIIPNQWIKDLLKNAI